MVEWKILAVERRCRHRGRSVLKKLSVFAKQLEAAANSLSKEGYSIMFRDEEGVGVILVGQREPNEREEHQKQIEEVLKRAGLLKYSGQAEVIAMSEASGLFVNGILQEWAALPPALDNGMRVGEPELFKKHIAASKSSLEELHKIAEECDSYATRHEQEHAGCEMTALLKRLAGVLRLEARLQVS